MKNAIKTFVSTLALTPEMTSFLIENKTDFAVCNVQVDEANGLVTFDTVTNFAKVETLTLNRDEQAVWDMYYDFDSNKNSANVVMHAIENKSELTDDSYDNQGKITPIAGAMKGHTFGEFWAILTDEQKTIAISIAKAWLAYNHIDLTSFDFFLINEGNKFKDGDYVMGYDITHGVRLATRVMQASPQGFVTCVDSEGLFTLGKEYRAEIVAKETLSPRIQKELDSQYEIYNTNAETVRTMHFEKAIDIAERASKQSAKAFESIDKAKITTTGLVERYRAIFTKNEKYFTADEKVILTEKINLAEKAIEANVAEVRANTEIQNKEFERLMSLKLSSPDAIAKAVGDANKAKLNKALSVQFKAKVLEANNLIKAKAEAEAEAGEGKKEVSSKIANIKKAKTSEPKAKPQTEEAKA